MELSEITKALREACCGAEWWQFVQSEVADALLHLFDNINQLGQSFYEAYVAAFCFEYNTRLDKGLAKPLTEMTVLFGKFPEEFYLSGIAPTKNLLRLNDWIEPNEADVYACVIFCRQISILCTMNALVDQTPAVVQTLKRTLFAAPKNLEDIFDVES